jgi:hypothetical protein
MDRQKFNAGPEQCPLLTQSGHAELHRTCPLLGVKRTSTRALQMSAFDPKLSKVKKHARWPEADIFTANLPKFARMVVARHRAEGPFKGGGVRYHTNGERHVR